MNRFLLHIGTMLASAICICALLSNAFAPFAWGNMFIERPMQAYLDNADRYDVLFLGNSRINTGVIPKLFDEAVGDAFPVTSFNMAVGNMSILEEWYIYKNLIEREHVRPAYVIFQIDAPYNQYYPGTVRGEYWMSTGIFRLALPLAMRQVFQQAYRMPLREVTTAYVWRLFNINLWETVVQKRQLVPMESQGGMLHPVLFGSLSMEEYELQVGRITRMLAHPCIDNNDLGLFRVIQKIRDESERYGIHPVFLSAPPQLFRPAQCVLRQLPEEQHIDYPSPEEFAELYRYEHFYNKEHFNELGAKLYTAYLAREFRRILEMRQ